MAYKKNPGEKFVRVPVDGKDLDRLKGILRGRGSNLRKFFQSVIKKFLDKES